MRFAAGSDEERLDLFGICLREIVRTFGRRGREREAGNERHNASRPVSSGPTGLLVPRRYFDEASHQIRSLWLNFRQRLLGIAKPVELHAHFVHHAEVQSAHLPVGVAAVVQILPALDLTACTAQHHHRQLGCVVVAVEHAGTKHQHRVVQQRAFTLLDRIHTAGKVRDLLQEELIDFQPVVRVVV